MIYLSESSMDGAVNVRAKVRCRHLVCLTCSALMPILSLCSWIRKFYKRRGLKYRP